MLAAADAWELFARKATCKNAKDCRYTISRAHGPANLCTQAQHAACRATSRADATLQVHFYLLLRGRACSCTIIDDSAPA